MDKYREVSKIGTGAHGTVLLCHKVDNPYELVVIKKVPVDTLTPAQRSNALCE